MKKAIIALIVGLACMTNAKAGDWHISIGIPGLIHVGNSYCPPPVVYSPPVCAPQVVYTPPVVYSSPVVCTTPTVHPGYVVTSGGYVPSYSVVLPQNRRHRTSVTTVTTTHTHRKRRN